MSIIIRGVDMPPNCGECLCDVVEYKGLREYCGGLRGEEITAQMNPAKGRLPQCPAIEIPTPHGRLIDADELLLRIQNGGNYLSPAILAFIETAETIIDKEE